MIPVPPDYRRTKRVSIVISGLLHDRLILRSNTEGRSLSNLCAFLLENALSDEQGRAQR
jgi:hypothetical protein